MSNNKNNSGMYGKGYYIALILCAAAIGISGYWYYRNTDQKEVTLQDPPAAVEATVAGREDVAVAATEPAPTQSSPTTAPTEAPGKGILKTAAPVEGQTVAVYAMEELSYNQTTRDWRTHSGVDIAAAAGTPVMAAADGVVYTAYEDDTMGTTVVIRHEGGYTTQYSSLGSELSVSAGDEVKLGQVIGCVGSTALLENALGDHVHFSVTYRDQQMDPAEFLSLGE